MKLLVEMAHPGHVHLFKNMIWELEKRGHKLQLVARDKEMTLELMDIYGFKYEYLGKNNPNILGKIIDMMNIEFHLLKICKRFNPDILLSAGSPYSAHVSAITGKTNITFFGAEHARALHRIITPFTDVIGIQSGYQIHLGKKHLPIDSYFELAYLHPNWFKPNPNIIDELGVKVGEPYTIVRFVSWNAHHDIGQIGMSNDEKIELVRRIAEHTKPIITSEGELPPELQQYKLNISPDRIHEALYYAQMYIGEGGTMAMESALLGTPNILINPLAKYCGAYKELRDKYQLQLFFDSIADGQDAALKLLKDKNSKKIWKKRREEMLKEKIDVTSYMVHFIDQYQEHNKTKKERIKYISEFAQNYNVAMQSVLND